MFWFYYVQWALTPVQKKLARDLLSIPDPPPNAYELLKERLLRLYDKGEKDRCRRLLSMPPLGGRRPSELLAEMLQLCPRDDVDGKIIRYMFLFRLTPTMQRSQWNRYTYFLSQIILQFNDQKSCETTTIFAFFLLFRQFFF